MPEDFLRECERMLDLYGVAPRPSRAALERLATPFTRRKTLERGAYYQSPVNAMYFVASGLVRVYFSVGDGKEWNKEFIVAPSVAGPLSGRAAARGLQVGLQALEDTELLEASYEQLKALAARDAEIATVLIALLESALRRKSLREKALVYQTAAQRYEALREAQPDLIARVPQYHLASYLGVTDVALSRIKHRSSPTTPAAPPAPLR